MKLVKTVSPAVLCNEITMDGLQWTFIPELHSDFITLREEEGEGRDTGRSRWRDREGERESRQLVLNHHRREMGCREMGGSERKNNIRMNG